MDRATKQPDLGNICYLRHCTILAPLKNGSRILFIGHTPPPSCQWITSKACAQNQTIIQIQSFFKSRVFADRLSSMGLIEEPFNQVKLNAANIIPLISVGIKPMGDPDTGRGFNDYQKNKRAQERNLLLLKKLITKGRYDIILLGWGKLSDALSPYSKAVVEYLRAEAESRTLIFCSVGHDEPATNWRKTYPGHPRGGFKHGIAAQPLSAYRRFRLPFDRVRP